MGVSTNSRSRQDWWGQGRRPILAGTVSGLVAGLAGLVATSLALGTLAGGFFGAVACGITVAYTSDASLRTLVGYAAVADVLSSGLFFGLVLLTYLAVVWATEGLAFVSAVWFSLMYVAFGVPLAFGVAGLSLLLTGAATVVTALVT